MTALQYALWARDIALCHLIVDRMPTTVALGELNQLAAFPEDFSEQGQYGSCFDGQEWLHQMDAFIAMPWNEKTCAQHWQEKVGKAQRDWPAHIVWRFCETGKDTSWIRQDMMQSFERQYKADHLNWWYQQAHEGSGQGVGSTWAAIRNAQPQAFAATNNIDKPSWNEPNTEVQHDYRVFQQLLTTLEEQYAALADRLQSTDKQVELQSIQQPTADPVSLPAQPEVQKEWSPSDEVKKAAAIVGINNEPPGSMQGSPIFRQIGQSLEDLFSYILYSPANTDTYALRVFINEWTLSHNYLLLPFKWSDIRLKRFLDYDSLKKHVPEGIDDNPYYGGRIGFIMSCALIIAIKNTHAYTSTHLGSLILDLLGNNEAHLYENPLYHDGDGYPLLIELLKACYFTFPEQEVINKFQQLTNPRKKVSAIKCWPDFNTHREQALNLLSEWKEHEKDGLVRSLANELYQRLTTQTSSTETVSTTSTNSTQKTNSTATPKYSAIYHAFASAPCLPKFPLAPQNLQLEKTALENLKNEAKTLPQTQIDELLKATAEGHLVNVENLLQGTPALAYVTGNVTDHSNRTFNNVSAFQYAVWALDIEMCYIILKYMDSRVAAEQLDALEQNPTNYSEHGAHYDITAYITYHEQGLPITTGLFKNYSEWDNRNLMLASLHSQLPSWLLYMWCEEGTEKAWTTQDPKKEIQRKINEDFTRARLNNGILFRGWMKRAIFYKDLRTSYDYRSVNLAIPDNTMLKKLKRHRAELLEKLRDELTQINQNPEQHQKKREQIGNTEASSEIATLTQQINSTARSTPALFSVPNPESRSQNPIEALISKAQTVAQPLWEQWATAVTQANLQQVEALLNANPELAYAKGLIKDHANREFTAMTGFQYAAWVRDIPMCDLILGFMSPLIAANQLEALETCPQQFSNYGTCFDFSEWINESNQFTNMNINDLLNHRDNLSNSVNKKLPCHIIFWLCSTRNNNQINWDNRTDINRFTSRSYGSDSIFWWCNHHKPIITNSIVNSKFESGDLRGRYRTMAKEEIKQNRIQQYQMAQHLQTTLLQALTEFKSRLLQKIVLDNQEKHENKAPQP